jgi:hypothetical protein
MATITKKELIDQIAERTQAKRILVKQTIQSFLDEIITELCKGNRLERELQELRKTQKLLSGLKCLPSGPLSLKWAG